MSLRRLYLHTETQCNTTTPKKQMELSVREVGYVRQVIGIHWALLDAVEAGERESKL